MAEGDLLSILNSTDLQKSDPRLYLVIKGLIDRVGGISIPRVGQQTNFVGVDTSTAAQTIALNQVVKGFTIIKDKSGNASVFNITLIGVVDGITDPVINTDFGEFRVYGSQGQYHNW